MTAKLEFFSCRKRRYGSADARKRADDLDRRECSGLKAADDEDDDYTTDVAALLKERLQRDAEGRLYVDAFLLTHPDKDHCSGLVLGGIATRRKYCLRIETLARTSSGFPLVLPMKRWPKREILRPDFIFFGRLSDGNIVADIVDPHSHHHLADALPKLTGLARYAEANGAIYRRIEAVAELNGGYKLLDLKEASVRGAVFTASNTKSLYESAVAIEYVAQGGTQG